MENCNKLIHNKVKKNYSLILSKKALEDLQKDLYNMTRVNRKAHGTTWHLSWGLTSLFGKSKAEKEYSKDKPKLLLIEENTAY